MNTYPEQWNLIKNFKGPQDGVERVFHDKYCYDEKSYYLGEWQKINETVMHGVGYYQYGENEYYCGDIKGDKWHGKGIMAYPDGSKIEITFVNGEMEGKGKMYEAEGSIRNVEYRNGEEI